MAGYHLHTSMCLILGVCKHFQVINLTKSALQFDGPFNIRRSWNLKRDNQPLSNSSPEMQYVVPAQQRHVMLKL